MPLIALTPDGKKIVSITASASGSIVAGSTGTVSVSIPMDILGKKLALIGVTSISVSGATVYLVGFSASTDKVDVTLYNPGTAVATVTVSVTVVVVGV